MRLGLIRACLPFPTQCPRRCPNNRRLHMSLALPSAAQLQIGAFKADQGGQQVWAYLGGAKDVQPHVNQIDPTQHPSPAFKGTPDDFLAANKGDPVLQRQMKNKVRKCPQCSKAVAFTLNNCNSCSADLTKVEISFTNNVFTGFIYGIEKGPFPFTVSMRYQDEAQMVFDDLLALCPCHLNVIPSKVFIPDWRFLLKNPAEGRKILDALYEKTWQVVKTQFLGNEAWRMKTIRNSEAYVKDLDQLKAHLAVGFNYPPSQYQLHLQFMLPPFTPFHYYAYLNGLHFTPGRFFPVEYARKVLDLNLKYEVDDNTPIEEIVAFFKTKGVDYDVIHKECYDRYGKSHELLANFDAKDFDYVVVENKKPFKLNGTDSLPEAQVDMKALQNDDKTVLQNYGRPYAEGNKPRGSFYAFPKQFPADVTPW